MKIICVAPTPSSSFLLLVTWSLRERWYITGIQVKYCLCTFFKPHHGSRRRTEDTDNKDGEGKVRQKKKKKEKKAHLQSVGLWYARHSRCPSVDAVHPERQWLSFIIQHKWETTSVYALVTETHHRCISEAFDGLKNPAADGSHCECAPTVIYYSPRTKHIYTEKKERAQTCDITYSNSTFPRLLI